MTPNFTSIDERVLNALRSHIKQHGKAPQITKLAGMVKTDLKVISRSIHRLTEQGIIRRKPRDYESIRIVSETKSTKPAVKKPAVKNATTHMPAAKPTPKKTTPSTKKPKTLNEAVKIAVQFGGTHEELKAVRKELVSKRDAIDAQIKQLDSATDVIEKILSSAKKIIASIIIK